MNATEQWIYKNRHIYGPLTADNIEPQDWEYVAEQIRAHGAGLRTVYRDCIYHRKRFVVTTALNVTSPTTFFTIQKGAQDTVGNAPGTAYTTQDIDTNMLQPSQLSKGQTFIVMSVQLELILTGATFTTLTSGDPTSPEAAAVTSAVNMARAIRYAGCGYLQIGERQYERGLIADFPQGPYGMIGFAGGLGVATNNESCVNNGLGRERRCEPFHVIDAGRQFQYDLYWRTALAPTNSFSIVCRLDGLRFTSVQ